MLKHNISKKDVDASILKDDVKLFNDTVAGADIGTEISIQKDTYTLRCDYAFQKFVYMTNNDFGLKNIAFPIIGKKDIVIDGNGADLNCIGRILPFYISDSENVTIKNFVIDYKRPFCSQGEIIAVDENSITLKINKEQFPYSIKNNILIFEGEDYTSDFVHGLLEFDAKGKRPVQDARDNALWEAVVAEELSNGVVKIYCKLKNPVRVGNMLSIKHERRYVPAIAINASKNVKLENIWIKHAGTMGVVGQFSENITLDKINVSVPKDSERVVSVSADATHFVGCRGKLLIENCTLEGQLDDVLNVHGNYLRVVKVINSKKVIAEIPHRQQVGAFGLKPGYRINICNDQTMLTEGVVSIKNTKTINNKFYELEFNEEFAFEEGKGYCVEDKDSYPEVIFRNNFCGRNRARCLLLTSNKPMLIEGNTIDAEGAPFKVSGDMTGWYESGATNSLIIRNNKIKRTNEVSWGKAIIDIDPEMYQYVDNKYFHKEIIIENNEIDMPDIPFAFGGSIEHLHIINNTIKIKNADKINDTNLPMDLKHCGDLLIQNNKYIKK